MWEWRIQEAKARFGWAVLEVGRLHKAIDQLPERDDDGIRPLGVMRWIDGEQRSLVPDMDGRLVLSFGPPFGGCVQHLHTTLEYLKTAVLEAPGSERAAAEPGNKYFPLFADQPEYEEFLGAPRRGLWISLLPQELSGALFDLQPFHGRPIVDHPLAILASVSPTDKHEEMISTTACIPAGRYNLRLGGEPGEPIWFEVEPQNTLPPIVHHTADGQTRPMLALGGSIMGVGWQSDPHV